MQLTNETALPVAWIEAEDDNWGCDEEDCEEGEVGIFIELFTDQGKNFKVCCLGLGVQYFDFIIKASSGRLTIVQMIRESVF